MKSSWLARKKTVEKITVRYAYLIKPGIFSLDELSQFSPNFGKQNCQAKFAQKSWLS